MNLKQRMTRLAESVRSALWVLRLTALMCLILVTWCVNPVLAVLRVKTPIRRWLVRQWDRMNSAEDREW